MGRSVAPSIGSAPTDTPDVRLVLSSTTIELRGFLKRCTRLRREKLPVQWASSGVFRGVPVLAIANGAGIERAYAAVGVPGLTSVWNLGFCGALDPKLRLGEVVVASQVGPDVPARPESALPAVVGPLYTSSTVVCSAREKLALYRKGAIAVDMEAVGAFRRARELNIPFYAVKCVSDLANEDLWCDYNRALRDDGSIRFSRLAMEAVMRPFTCLPELIRLGKRSLIASERLGEYLAACKL